MQQEFCLGNLIIPYKGIDADYHGTPEDINGWKVDDADKKALSPMNLITEVHKMGLCTYFILLGTKATACLIIIMTPFRVPSFYKLGIDAVFRFYRYSCKSKKEKAKIR
jgi:hypothetical protein